MADGRLAMWLPTSTTLQQLEHVRSIEEIRSTALARPARRDRGRGALARGHADRDAGRWRRGRAAGLAPTSSGAAGSCSSTRAIRPVRRSIARSRSRRRATARSRPSRSPMSTRTMPPAPRPWRSDSGSRSSPVRAAVGRCHTTVRELADLELLDAGDVRLRAILTPGPRPDHVAYLADERGVRPGRRPRRAARRPLDPRPAGRRRLGVVARAPRRPGADRTPPDRASGDARRPGLT